MSKKELSLSLFDEGIHDVESIAQRVGANPTYVANTLIGAGRSVEYQDLYTSSRPRNRYGDDFNGVLRFKDVPAAQESVRKLNLRYEFYRETGDRQGQYHARALALIGYERAMGLNKTQEAQLFAEWLKQTLDNELNQSFLPEDDQKPEKIASRRTSGADLADPFVSSTGLIEGHEKAA